MSTQYSKIRFEVPYNGDPELVQAYLNYSNRIAMVYGRAEDGYPQGRKTAKTRHIPQEEVYEQADLLQQKGIKFNYLLNGTSHANREYDVMYRRAFVDHVRSLAQNGIKIVTIGNPLLIQAVVDEVPEIEVFASVLMEVDCLTRMKKIASLGVKYICLSKTLLKNFVALETIGQCGEMDVEFVLLANDPCLHHCALTAYHNDTLSHLTSGGATCDAYSRLHCTRSFATDKRNVISASFIRPEDVRTYANLGYGLFKLCDRKHPTQWVLRALHAYMGEYYDGNLAELMAPWNRHGGEYGQPMELTQDELERLGSDAYRDYLRFTPFIDNRSLDGYLTHWLVEKQRGCRDEDCDACGYCARVAVKAMRGDPRRVKVVVRNIDKALRVSISIKPKTGE